MATKKQPVKKATKKMASSSTKKVSGALIFTQYDVLKNLVSEMEEDVRKFADEGVKASAKRIRKAAQELKKTAQQLRKDVIVLVKQSKA